MPLPKHRTTHKQYKRTDVHASNVIRNHEPSCEQAKIVHALDHEATTIGFKRRIPIKFFGKNVQLATIPPRINIIGYDIVTVV
jgi:hypothetical protein